MSKFEDIRKKLLGKRFDIDKSFGAQCWDGYAQYMKELGYSYANCTKTGYVKDIWTERKTNGMLNSCDEVTVMQPGDIAVFKETDGWTPLSHVAIFVRDVDGEYGIFLGQNQGGKNGAFNEIKFPYYATYDTAFRPKCLKGSKPSTGGNTTTNKKPDQILTVNSKVEFTGFLRVESYKNGMVYNSRIGGYVPVSLVYEDSAKDGKKDQYLSNTNATFTIPGTFTVGDVSAKNNTVYLKELGFWVKAEPLIEVKEGK